MEDDAVGYVRVSSQEQRGGGLTTQEASIRAYCGEHGLRLLRVDRDDALSGSNGLDTRIGMAAALRSFEAGEASVLVVYDYSRLAQHRIRRETTIQRLGQAGARVVSVTEPESDVDESTRALIGQVLGAVDQYNRAVIRAKMEAGRNRAVAEGRRGQGASPYGYRSEGGRLHQIPEEQEVLSRIGQLRGAGASLREICRELNDAGVSARRGGRWHPNTVSGVLQTGALGDEAPRGPAGTIPAMRPPERPS